MTSPAFDAALLLRGLRAMDAALGEGYDVQNHTCVPAPVAYSKEFPAAGFDFSKYQGGFAGVKGVWQGWMYDDGGKGKLKTTVHEDVEATVVEAFDIFTKIDKNKDGIVTKEEWEKAEKAKSADDQLFDLEYLSALQNVTAKMVALEKGVPLNPADPNAYPEVIQLKQANAGLGQALEASQKETVFYKQTSMGLGGALGTVVLLLGIRALWRSRTADETPSTRPSPESPRAEPSKEPASSAPKDDLDMNDVLSEIAKSKLGESSVTADNVLIEGADSKPVNGVATPVLKAQIALHFRHFLSQAARDCLTDGKSIPAGAKLINTSFERDVDRLVDALVVEYNELAKKDPAGLEELWKEQKENGIPLVRRGVPQQMLLAVARDYLMAEAAVSTSPFSGGVAEDVLRDAERRTIDLDLAKGLPEMLRHIGR